MTRRYYQLLASLPHLAGFDRLKALPLGPLRFEARLALLDPADHDVVTWLRAAIWPERESLRLAGACPVELPAVAIALADRAAAIRRAFSARRGEEDVVALERERLGAIWDSADRLIGPHGFGLEAVLRAVIRWDVGTAWLAADAVRSGQRIEALAEACMRDWQQAG